MRLGVDRKILELVKRMELGWGPHGIDPYGISQVELARFYSVLALLYRRYFSLDVDGIEHIPPRGRAMLVGNHSGGWALDGIMVLTSAFLEMEPPRLAQGMADFFINKMPFGSLISSRTGHFPGVPGNATHLLNHDRLLMVFPEGARGTAKLYKERNSLVHFGTGFMRIALETKSPIVPFGFVGGGEAIPTIFNLYKIGKMLGAPYIPVTPWLVAIPRPTSLQITYGEPMVFEGTGDEDDRVVQGYVDEVKQRIADLIAEGNARRRGGPS